MICKCRDVCRKVFITTDGRWFCLLKKTVTVMWKGHTPFQRVFQVPYMCLGLWGFDYMHMCVLVRVETMGRHLMSSSVTLHLIRGSPWSLTETGHN